MMVSGRVSPRSWMELEVTKLGKNVWGRNVVIAG